MIFTRGLLEAIAQVDELSNFVDRFCDRPVALKDEPRLKGIFWGGNLGHQSKNKLGSSNQHNSYDIEEI